MSDADLSYYGVSPWEVEVAYGYLNSRFDVNQAELEPDERFVSHMGIALPVHFSREFFRWFGFTRWEKLKALFKEMKRRRGSGNALNVEISFAGAPDIKFTTDVSEHQWFAKAIDGIDFVLELIPYQLAPNMLPAGTSGVGYRFDVDMMKWSLDAADTRTARYLLRNNTWKSSKARTDGVM